MSDDIWSKQFYKTLEAVDKLTEEEKFRLGEMLIALSNIKKELVTLSREVHLSRSEFKHTLSVEDLPKHSCGSEFYNVPSPSKPPETRKLKGDGLIPQKTSLS